jgi:hypothetical protein
LERRLRSTLKSARQRLAPRAAREVVFVAGMQRSGTNLLMEVLDDSGATQVFHETDTRAFDNYQMRDPETIRGLVRASPAPVVVVKALCELDRLTSLMANFAPAKTIWIVRDWRACVASAIRSFGGFVPQWQRLAQGDRGDWRGRGMSDDTRSILGGLWSESASEADGAAIMWYYRNVLYFEQALERDQRARLVFYEDLLRRPADETRDVFAFLGIDAPPPRAAGRIRSGVAEKRGSPDVATPVARLCDGLWSRFESLRARAPA